MGDTILIRRGTLANLPALQTGEPGWADDSNQLFVGTTTGSAASAMPIGNYDYAPELFTQASIETTLTLIGTTNKRTLRLRTGNWVILTAMTIPKNVTLLMADGAYFSGAGADEIVFGNDQVIRPEWWGAIPNGTTDCSTAISTAIKSIHASGLSTLTFSNGTYYLDSAVTVLFDSNYSLRLTGTATAGTLSSGVGAGTKITGKAGLLSLFLLTKTDLTTFGLYAFEVDHIAFLGDLATHDGSVAPYSAILNKVGGGPARPFSVHHCDFRGFDKAISSDITTAAAAGLSTGIGTVAIKNNTFTSNTHALYSTGAGAIRGLDFSNNVSEQGGQIQTASAGLSGGFRICDNLLEGQNNAIRLDVGYASGEICRNDFEGSGAYIIQMAASNPNSSVTVKDNYYVSMDADAKSEFYGLKLYYYDNSYRADTDLIVERTTGKSVIENLGYMFGYQLAQGGVNLDISSVPLNTTFPTSTMTAGDWQVLTGTVEDTPIGLVNVEKNPSDGVNVYQKDTALSSGDWVVFQALARRRTGIGGLSISMWAADGVTAIGNSETSYGIRETAIGEWIYVMRYVKATGASVGHFHWKWAVEAASAVDITDTHVHVITPVVLATTQIQLGLPKKTMEETVTAVAHTAITTRGTTKIDSTLGAIAGLTLGSGDYTGVIKTIIMTVDNGDATLSVTLHETSDPEIFTFDNVGDTLTLQWTGLKWVTLHNYGVTVP